MVFSFGFNEMLYWDTGKRFEEKAGATPRSSREAGKAAGVGSLPPFPRFFPCPDLGFRFVHLIELIRFKKLVSGKP